MIQLVTPQCIQFMVKAGHTVMEVWTDMPGNGFIASIAGQMSSLRKPELPS